MGKYTAAVDDHLELPALACLPAGDARLRRRSAARVPAPVPVRLVIDTGSRRTTLIPGVIRQLELMATTQVRVATALSSGVTYLFWVRLDFPKTGLAAFDPVQVASLDMPARLSRFHGVLG